MTFLTPDDLGPAALVVAGFQLWIHGREFPEASDAFDGNWLRVTAHCGANGASVWTQGPIVMTSDVSAFGDACRELYDGRASSPAVLDPLEPNLCVTIEAVDRLGHLEARVEITPDHLTQSHTVAFAIDQTYLPPIIRACEAIVTAYPVRGDD